jgi:Co/Zn/Cd efflux system component
LHHSHSRSFEGTSVTRDPEHGHGHQHQGHEHNAGHWGAALLHRLGHLLRPHSHDTADKVDPAMESSVVGMRAVWISFVVLAATAAAQAVVVIVSGSVALLGDTLHNFADALTAVPLGIAFLLGRRAATRRYTYGYGRAEDLAGIVIVLMIAGSAAFAGYEAIQRLLNPEPVDHLIYVAVAAVVGFIGNELVARYRIMIGRRIGSAALVADGLHARTDGFTSLAVLLERAGWPSDGIGPTRASVCSSPWPLRWC